MARDGGQGRRGYEKENWVGVGQTATDLLQGVTREVLVRQKLGLEVLFVDRLQLQELDQWRLRPDEGGGKM